MITASQPLRGQKSLRDGCGGSGVFGRTAVVDHGEDGAEHACLGHL